MALSPAPFFSDIAEGPEGGQAFWLNTQDGLRIRVGHWTASGALEGESTHKGTPAEATPSQGTVLLFPGRTEYIEKYGPVAQDLARFGFDTLTVDWRGQGLADRMLDDRRLGHVEQFLDFQRDVQALLEFAKSQALPKPWYLLGHSMGGAIGLRALHEGLPVVACAFTGPMWGIRIPPVMRPLALLLQRFGRPLGVSHKIVPTTTYEQYVEVHPFEGNTLTNDPEMYAFLQAHMAAKPELALGGPTIHWLTEAMAECDALAQMPPPGLPHQPALPCLTFLGRQENIVSQPAVKARMANWPGGTLQMVEDAQHEILMERPAVRQAVFAQLARHFSTAAAAADTGQGTGKDTGANPDPALQHSA